MEHTESIGIDRPPDAVWQLVGDIHSWPRWLEDISDVEMQSDELGEGAEFTYKFRGRPAHVTVFPFEADRVIGITAPERGYDFAESITVEPQGEGTVVTFTMGFEPNTWWMKTVAIGVRPLKDRLMGRPLRKELAKLKAVAEGTQ